MSKNIDLTVLLSGLPECNPAILIKKLRNENSGITKVYLNKNKKSKKFSLRVVFTSPEQVQEFISKEITFMNTKLDTVAMKTVAEEKLKERNKFVTNPSVFLKGIPLDMTPAVLKELFTSCVEPLDVKINAKKKKYANLTGFVAFKTLEDKQKAMTIFPDGILTPSGSSIQIEEKSQLSTDQLIRERAAKKQSRMEAIAIERAKKVESRKQLKIQKDKEKKELKRERAEIISDVYNSKKYSAYLTDLPNGIRKSDIHELFQGFGEILKITIYPKQRYHIDPNQPVIKKYAFVNFKTEESLVNAISQFKHESIKANFSNYSLDSKREVKDRSQLNL
jgi:RNA recognition motif-containing protein